MTPLRVSRVQVSHAEVVWDQAARERENAAWRRQHPEPVPADPREPAPRPTVTVTKTPPAPVRQAKDRRGGRPKPAPVPDGSLLLTPREVEALDHLLATHPALKGGAR